MKKNGRTVSIEVKELIHAPPIPSDKSNKGPTQQADAPIADSTAPIPNQVVLFSVVSCSVAIFVPLRTEDLITSRSLAQNYGFTGVSITRRIAGYATFIDTSVKS